MTAHLPATANIIAFLIIAAILTAGYIVWACDRAPLVDENEQPIAEPAETLPIASEAWAVVQRRNEIQAELQRGES